MTAESKARGEGWGVELLAPAGDWECARAAVANGADAIYFGAPRFNARARAENFGLDEIAQLMAFLHGHGVRGLAAFNTLIFPGELEAAAEQLLALEAAGVDAVIVQDLGLARMVRELTPGLALHGSTQMTVSSPEGLALVDGELGLDRVVLARENSLREIRLFRGEGGRPRVPLEVFVHGALCVAYSGQCLTSESLGQRSANRGECAQACRMPYELWVDGERRELGDRRYLLSPQDLAGYGELGELLEAGVTGFKIEGRLKSPEYVAAVTAAYRRALDAAMAGRDPEGAVGEEGRYGLEMTFSRGLTTGWLHGVQHQELVGARYGKKRGAYVGRVARVARDEVELEDMACEVKAGDGLVFDMGGDTDREQGGRAYGVVGRVVRFGRGRVDLGQVREGARVWKTDDPALRRVLRDSWGAAALVAREIKRGLSLRVWGREGEPLRVAMAVDGRGEEVVESSVILERARRHALGSEQLWRQLGRLGGTGYELAGLDVELEGELMVPVSELNRMRRELVGRLGGGEGDAASPGGAGRESGSGSVGVRVGAMLAAVEGRRGKGVRGGLDEEVEMSVLCRTEEQLWAMVEEGVGRLYLDLEDVRRYRGVVAEFRVRAGEGQQIYLATPRIQKSGEVGLFRLIERAEADGVLVRNLGAVAHFGGRVAAAGDFSLNVSNALTADFFLGFGLELLTVSYDLDVGQVVGLLGSIEARWFELTVHQHMPMFHMEHCVFCAFLSEGTDFTNCGRPCDRHRVELRDRVGQRHVLLADVGCRNTLFNGRAQSGARYLGLLREAGLRRVRVELLGEDGVGAKALLGIYRELLAGRAGGEEVLAGLKVRHQLGVTEGTLVP